MQTLIRIEDPKSGIGLFQAVGIYTKEDVLNDSSRREGDWYGMSALSQYDQDIWARHQQMVVAIYACRGFKIGRHYCAYRSLDELKSWMEDEWIKDVIRIGFRVYMIEVSECLNGSQQAAFELRHIISKKDISELFLN
jgi:hypothetical protein